MLEIINNYIGILILGIGEILFANIVTNKKIEVNKRKFFIVFVISRLFHTITYICFSGTIKTFTMYIIHCLEFKILFKLNNLKSIFLTFLYIVVIMIADLFGIWIITNVVGINALICFNEISGTIISNLLVCVLFVLVTLILKKPLRKMFNTEISTNTKIVLLSLATLWCVIYFLYVFGKELTINGNVIPYLISMIVLIVILFSLIRKTLENSKLMKEYDQLLEFMTSYEEEIEKQRILRHETKNEFLSIKAKLCDKQNNKEIVDYIDEILKDKIIVNNEKYAKFGYLPPNGIKGLCYFKVQEAENRNITVSLNISAKIKKSNINDLSIKEQRDLGKLLGIFLDNAIEASGTSKKKQLGIESYISNDDEFIMIITNTFDEEVNRSKIGKERFTTKGKDRGHGLLLAKHIIGNNNIFETKTEILNGVYVQSITIKKEKTNE